MRTTEIPEFEAIQRAKRGDEAACEALYREYKPAVLSLCSRMTMSPADAEDITQDVFLQLFRNISSFRGEAKLSTWLYRIAVNCTLIHLRKRERTAVALPSMLLEDISSLIPGGGNKHSAITSPLRRLALAQAVSRLTSQKRSVFLLHDLNGLSHREIAHQLGLSIGNSRCRLHRAHSELRAILCA